MFGNFVGEASQDEKQPIPHNSSMLAAPRIEMLFALDKNVNTKYHENVWGQHTSRPGKQLLQ